MAEYIVPPWCLYITVGLSAMNEFILVPAIAYYTYKFWTLRNDIFFAKRHPKLVVFYSLCMAFNPLLRPYMLYEYWYGTEPFGVKMLGYYTSALSFTAAFARFWLTLYDFNYNQSLYQQKIEQHIKHHTDIHYNESNSAPSATNTNNSINTNTETPEIAISDIEAIDDLSVIEESWWIKHRGYFGKVKGLLISATIILVIYGIIVTYLRYLNKLFCLGFHFMYLLTITMCGIVAVRKISRYRDEFYIFDEGNAVKKPALLFLLLFGSSIVIEPLFVPLSNIISTILTFLAASVGISIFTIITLYWGLHRYHSEYVLVEINDSKQNNMMVTINECIHHKEGYYIFFEYLIGEFSVENLDFITDVIYIKQKFGGNIKGDIIAWPKLPRKLYLSANMRCSNLYDAIMSIYRLYIKEGSVREINISYDQRQETKTKTMMMNENEADSIDVDIFDICVDEAVLLMSQAYNRFIQTKEYQIFANAVQESNKNATKCSIIRKINKNESTSLEMTVLPQHHLTRISSEESHATES